MKDDVQDVAFFASRLPFLFLLRRPSLSHALPARLLWLLATLFDDLAPSAGVVRCCLGPTMRSATMSCVCSTRGSPHALNSHLLLAHLEPSPRPCAPPGLSLRSRAPLGLNFSLLLSLCFLSIHFSLSLFLSLSLFSRFLRSPLFSRLLRSPLFLSRLLLAFFFLL